MIAVQRKILLNPGPVTTADAIKAALLVPDICPREQDFGAVIAAVRRKLLMVADADPNSHSAVLIGGPGTAAMESAIGSLVPANGRLMIIDNGAYGQRAAEIAAALAIPFDVWHLPWTERPPLDQLRARLDRSGPFTHLFWVHHETTTGLLNPLRSICRLCAERGIVSIVDAMSSLGGLPLSLRNDGIDFVISSANKCLEGMPGISFVIGPTALIADSVSIGRTYALNLWRHWSAQEKTAQFPFTPPVQVLYVLDQALDHALIETIAARAARYHACYRVMLDGMISLGFEPLLPRELHSGLLTAFRLPSWTGFSFIDFHDFLYARGITLYPGKLPGVETFRVANIGALSADDLQTFVDAARMYLKARNILADAPGVAKQRLVASSRLHSEGVLKC
jgi:2-aminoethylphosphonate-pyruvate transaminase